MNGGLLTGVCPAIIKQSFTQEGPTSSGGYRTGTLNGRQLFVLPVASTAMDHDAEISGIGMGVGPDGEEIPAVILRARDELLPIFITSDQANSIRLAMAGEPFERPLTHDLLVEMLTEFGGAVDSVRIDDLADGTFYAKIDAERYVDGEREKFVFDARPSDAIALAARFECPITVSDEILDTAGQPPDSIRMEEPDGSTGDEYRYDPGGDDDDDFR